MKAALVIFDMDGVVVDTVPVHFAAWRRMFLEAGVEKFDFQDYVDKVDGIPRHQGCRNVLTWMSDDEIEEWSSKKQQYFLGALAEVEVKPFADTVRMWDRLDSAGIPFAVASSSRNAPHILERIGLRNRPAAIVCGSDFKKSKPDPEIFLTAALRAGIEPVECAVIEDALTGIRAAKNAGMKSVGICRDRPLDDLGEADLVVSSLDDVEIVNNK